MEKEQAKRAPDPIQLQHSLACFDRFLRCRLAQDQEEHGINLYLMDKTTSRDAHVARQRYEQMKLVSLEYAPDVVAMRLSQAMNEADRELIQLEAETFAIMTDRRPEFRYRAALLPGASHPRIEIAARTGRNLVNAHNLVQAIHGDILAHAIKERATARLGDDAASRDEKNAWLDWGMRGRVQRSVSRLHLIDLIDRTTSRTALDPVEPSEEERAAQGAVQGLVRDIAADMQTKIKEKEKKTKKQSIKTPVSLDGRFGYEEYDAQGRRINLRTPRQLIDQLFRRRATIMPHVRPVLGDVDDAQREQIRTMMSVYYHQIDKVTPRQLSGDHVRKVTALQARQLAEDTIRKHLELKGERANVNLQFTWQHRDWASAPPATYQQGDPRRNEHWRAGQYLGRGNPGDNSDTIIFRDMLQQPNPPPLTSAFEPAHLFYFSPANDGETWGTWEKGNPGETWANWTDDMDRWTADSLRYDPTNGPAYVDVYDGNIDLWRSNRYVGRALGGISTPPYAYLLARRLAMAGNPIYAKKFRYLSEYELELDLRGPAHLMTAGEHAGVPNFRGSDYELRRRLDLAAVMAHSEGMPMLFNKTDVDDAAIIASLSLRHVMSPEELDALLFGRVMGPTPLDMTRRRSNWATIPGELLREDEAHHIPRAPISDEEYNDSFYWAQLRPRLQHGTIHHHALMNTDYMCVYIAVAPRVYRKFVERAPADNPFAMAFFTLFFGILIMIAVIVGQWDTASAPEAAYGMYHLLKELPLVGPSISKIHTAIEQWVPGAIINASAAVGDIMLSAGKAMVRIVTPQAVLESRLVNMHPHTPIANPLQRDPLPAYKGTGTVIENVGAFRVPYTRPTTLLETVKYARGDTWGMRVVAFPKAAMNSVEEDVEIVNRWYHMHGIAKEVMTSIGRVLAMDHTLIDEKIFYDDMERMASQSDEARRVIKQVTHLEGVIQHLNEKWRALIEQNSEHYDLYLPVRETMFKLFFQYELPAIAKALSPDAAVERSHIRRLVHIAQQEREANSSRPFDVDMLYRSTYLYVDALQLEKKATAQRNVSLARIATTSEAVRLLQGDAGATTIANLDASHVLPAGNSTYDYQDLHVIEHANEYAKQQRAPEYIPIFQAEVLQALAHCLWGGGGGGAIEGCDALTYQLLQGGVHSATALEALLVVDSLSIRKIGPAVESFNWWFGTSFAIPDQTRGLLLKTPPEWIKHAEATKEALNAPIVPALYHQLVLYQFGNESFVTQWLVEPLLERAWTLERGSLAKHSNTYYTVARAKVPLWVILLAQRLSGYNPAAGDDAPIRVLIAARAMIYTSRWYSDTVIGFFDVMTRPTYDDKSGRFDVGDNPQRPKRGDVLVHVGAAPYSISSARRWALRMSQMEPWTSMSPFSTRQLMEAYYLIFYTAPWIFKVSFGLMPLLDL